MDTETPDAQPETETGTQTDPHPDPGHPDPCDCNGPGDCDLGSIEDLACSAKRYQKQAEVVTKSLEQINGFKESFGTARATYQAARDASAADVAAALTELDDVLGQLRCRLDDDQETCLDDALKKVIACILECAGEPGCCVGPCEFDSDAADDAAPVLMGRIEQYRRDVAKSADCFTSLIAEITDLPGRATALKELVAAIAEDARAEGKATDWARLYARAIVAHWKLQPAQLYRGYATVNDFVDCLCRALMCVLKGWEAIALLEGIAAEMDCKADASDAECRRKQDDMVGEVMSRYDRCCTREQPTPPEGECEEDPPPPPKKPCGCSGHHHEGEETSA